jgi:hypothetical protein
MGRAKLKALRETTLNTFFELSSRFDLNSQYRYNSQSGVIYWNNGSEILLKDLFTYPSDPNFDSLGSLEITGAFIDECNQISFKAWQIVKSRIRYKLKEYKVVVIPQRIGFTLSSIYQVRKIEWILINDLYKLYRQIILTYLSLI